jgi:hypothetical protein
VGRRLSGFVLRILVLVCGCGKRVGAGKWIVGRGFSGFVFRIMVLVSGCGKRVGAGKWTVGRGLSGFVFKAIVGVFEHDLLTTLHNNKTAHRSLILDSPNSTEPTCAM